jgi:hypothetical protein
MMPKVRAQRPTGQRSPEARHHEAVFRRHPHVCVMCQEFPVDAAIHAARPQDFEWLQAAHVIPKRDLIGEDRADGRNGLILCVFHHARHDHAVEKVPRRLLPACVFEFARDTQFEWKLDLDFPQDPDQANPEGRAA